MIHLTRLNRVPLVLNADLIESIEATPDTVISLTTGQKLMVRETAAEIVRRVVEFRRAIYGRWLPGQEPEEGPDAPPDGGQDGTANRMGHAR